MKVMVFGATGMVGQGVLRECLLDPGVERVLTVGRKATGQTHDKLRELVHADLFDVRAIEPELSGYDACFFCLGVSSVGMTEAEYRRLTYDLTMAVAEPLARLNPPMTFIYVSGAGTDSTERGRMMWARVKGKTENALLRLPFEAAYMFRPAFIRPLHGVVPRLKSLRLIVAVTGPMYPLLKAVFPKYVTTTVNVGRAMIRVARDGAAQPVIESREIDLIGGAEPASAVGGADVGKS